MPTSDASEQDEPEREYSPANIVANASAVHEVLSDGSEGRDDDTAAANADGRPTPADEVPALQRKRGRPQGTISKPKVKATEDKELGIEAYLLPKSTITKLAKTAIPYNIKLRGCRCLDKKFGGLHKLPNVSVCRGNHYLKAAVVNLRLDDHDRAQEQAAEAKVKTIKPEHVFDALPELDWGEADTIRLRKELKKQLKAYRAIAKAKKDGVSLPIASSSKSGFSRKAVAGQNQPSIIEDDSVDEDASATASTSLTEANVHAKGKSATRSTEEPESSSSDDEEDEPGVRRLKDDRGGDQDEDELAEESPIDDDDEEGEEDEDEDDIVDEEDDPEDPDDLEDEMGRGLDGTPPRQEDEEMDETH